MNPTKQKPKFAPLNERFPEDHLLWLVLPQGFLTSVDPRVCKLRRWLERAPDLAVAFFVLGL